MLAFDNWRSKLSINACTIYSHDMVRVLRAYPCMHRAIASCRFYCKSYFICACSTYSYICIGTLPAVCCEVTHGHSFMYNNVNCAWTILAQHSYFIEYFTPHDVLQVNILLCNYLHVTLHNNIMHACCTCYCDGLKWQRWSCTYTASISFATATYVMSDVMVAAVTTYLDNVTSNVIKLWQLLVCNP